MLRASCYNQDQADLQKESYENNLECNALAWFAGTINRCTPIVILMGAAAGMANSFQNDLCLARDRGIMQGYSDW